MSKDVLDEVWEHSSAKGSDLLLLLAIAYLADDDGFLTATAKTLAEKSRMSVRNVYRTTQNLEEQGLVMVLERGAGRSSSRYRVVRSGDNLSPQAARSGDELSPQGGNGADRSGANLSPQAGDPDLWCQSVTTTDGASGDNLAPRDGLWCQSVTTTDTPIEGTRAHAHPEVGRKDKDLLPTYLPEPTDRAREQPHAHDDPAAADNDIAALISTINFKRSLRADEFERIFALVAIKRNHGWSIDAIRNAVDGDWDKANSRVAVITSRLRQLPIAPPAPPRPKRAGRCEFHLLPLPCIGCDADAKAADHED